jgi:hypothetical protein
MERNGKAREPTGKNDLQTLLAIKMESNTKHQKKVHPKNEKKRKSFLS